MYYTSFTWYTFTIISITACILVGRTLSSPLPGSSRWLTPCQGSIPASEYIPELESNETQPLDVSGLIVSHTEALQAAVEFKTLMLQLINDTTTVNRLDKLSSSNLSSALAFSIGTNLPLYEVLEKGYGQLSRHFIMVEDARLNRDVKDEKDESILLVKVETKILQCLCDMFTEGIYLKTPLSRDTIVSKISLNSRSKRDERDYVVIRGLVTSLQFLIPIYQQFVTGQSTLNTTE